MRESRRRAAITAGEFILGVMAWLLSVVWCTPNDRDFGTLTDHVLPPVPIRQCHQIRGRNHGLLAMPLRCPPIASLDGFVNESVRMYAL